MRKTIFPLVLLATITAANADTRPHLCARGEEAVFACATGAKLVSLCASPDITANSGTLRYLFGTRAKIELAHPAAGISPRAAFSRGVTGGTAGGADFLRFGREGVTYTLFSDHYRGRERDGLVVERGGKRITVLICRGSALNPDKNWGTIYNAGLPDISPDFETP